MKGKTWVVGLVVFVCSVFVVNSAESQGIFEKLTENLKKETIEANENGARTRVKTIVLLCEMYKSDNGHYPNDESDLLNAKPPYSQQAYNNKEIHGYNYSIEFRLDRYKIIATPVECGKTGNKIFIAENILTEDIIKSISLEEIAEKAITEIKCE